MTITARENQERASNNPKIQTSNNFTLGEITLSWSGHSGHVTWLFYPPGAIK